MRANWLKIGFRWSAIGLGVIALLALGAWILSLAVPAYRLWAMPPVAAVADDGGWRDYGHDLGGQRNSPLAQINTGTVHGLREAWRYSTGEMARQLRRHPTIAASFQNTPILVGTSLVGCTHSHRVFALDARTGGLRWEFDPRIESSERGDQMLKCRGVAQWTDPDLPASAPCATRIVYAAQLAVYALDAANGRLCAGFGANGKVAVSPPGREFPDEVVLRSPPLIAGHVVVVGSALADIYRINSPSGEIRAFDVRTGRPLWTFDPVPRDPADPARASWGKGSANLVGSANMWSFMSADARLGLVYVPTTSPAADYYGAERPGANLYANSLVALDIETGKVRWAFQTTHHDVWDTDLPAQPILTDITRNGRRLPAVVQLTKQGQIFVLDRRDGRPIFPVEERPVWTKTDVPGEVLSPTQPFSPGVQTPVRFGIFPNDAWGFTPIDRNACRRKIERFETHGPFTPPTLRGSVMLPALAGGMNWGGGAVSSNGVLIVPSMDLPATVKLVPRNTGSGGRTAAESGGAMLFPMKGAPYEAEVTFLLSPLGAPCIAPPWATISAISLSTGRILWRKPLGTIEQFTPVVRIPLKFGSPFTGGPIVTAGGLAFMAGTNDNSLRAFDVKTGEVLWRGRLPAAGVATPMTYAIGGRQYVVVAAGGSNLFPGPVSDELVAFALPEDKIRR